MLRDNLRAAIKASGLAVKEVAYKAGISNRALEKWLASDAVEPKAIAFVKVCKVLGVSPFDIVGLAEPKYTYDEVFLLETAKKHKDIVSDLEALDYASLSVLRTQVHALAQEASQTEKSSKEKA